MGNRTCKVEQPKPQGIEVIARDWPAFADYVKAENAKWSKVIQDRGLKLN